MAAPLHIEIKQSVPGFDRFMGSWIIREEKTVLLDAGPANSVENLLAGLEENGIDHIDYVFISHIHIDHAGGVARVLERYPEAAAICHAKGLKFLVNPEKLWEGSQKVLGELALVYGPPPPIPEERLIPHTEADVPGMEIIETPGHAPHHLSFTYGGRLFAGEAGGNLFIVNGEEYLRPATPPRFFLKDALSSVEKLLALDDQPIYYAHFENADSSRRMLERFKKQLVRWAEIIATEAALGGPEGLEERCIEAILRDDPELKAFKRMNKDAREREKTFIGNSVRGYIGFINDKK